MALLVCVITCCAAGINYFLLLVYQTFFMRAADWIVLIITLAGIVLYGLYKSKTSRNLEGYFLSNRTMPWYVVLLSIMGTQASAVTFLSAPGQAFTDGMRFVQYYFGLPLAMIVISITFVPLFNKLKVFTAYEFLEQRFDVKTRLFTASLFLLSRAFSTGISIYAPSIILSSLLSWNIFWTNIIMGGILIIYTVSGGAKAVAHTQQVQFTIIVIAMMLAGYYIVHNLPEGIGFSEALKVSGASGKLNVITTGITEKGFEWKDRYNIISGLVGGFFLALSYFGTDQSQVGRYLTAKSNTESRLGLLMNGLVKVPMQFLILLLGALLFTYYLFSPSPIFFNKTVSDKVYATQYGDSLKSINKQYEIISKQQQQTTMNFATSTDISKAAAYKKTLAEQNMQIDALRKQYKTVLQKADAGVDTNDTNYIFLYYVIENLPAGLVGLLIAVIFLASWGSVAAALNSLASCTMIDFYCRLKKNHSLQTGQQLHEEKQFRQSKWATLCWGAFCIIVAQFANHMGSLIEAVNVLGSLFYGVILGIFLVAFYLRHIKSNAVFTGAIIGEIIVMGLYILDSKGIIGLGFLWLNVVGALAVVILSLLTQRFAKSKAL